MSLTRLDVPSRFFVVDAFTSEQDEELQGNPAGVLITARPLTDIEAETIAKTLKLPALALLSDPALFETGTLPESVDLPIAWLAPEGFWIPLCGHATMAASLVLFQLLPQTDQLQFSTRLGATLPVSRYEKSRAELGLPAAERLGKLCIMERPAVLDNLERATGLKQESIVALNENGVSKANRVNLLVELSPEVDLKTLEVDAEVFRDLAYHGVLMIVGGQENLSTIKVRVFWPKVGILEDQVCGSAHTAFAPYWIEKNSLHSESQEAKIVSKQVSPKGGLLGVRWDKKWGEDGGTVWLQGGGKIYDRGSLQDVLPE